MAARQADKPDDRRQGLQECGDGGGATTPSWLLTLREGLLSLRRAVPRSRQKRQQIDECKAWHRATAVLERAADLLSFAAPQLTEAIERTVFTEATASAQRALPIAKRHWHESVSAFSDAKANHRQRNPVLDLLIEIKAAHPEVTNRRLCESTVRLVNSSEMSGVYGIAFGYTRSEPGVTIDQAVAFDELVENLLGRLKSAKRYRSKSNSRRQSRS